MELIIASQIRPVLRSLHIELPQAILLHGESGAGLTTIARTLAGKGHDLIAPTTSKTSTNESISIETIRQLYIQSRSKHERQVFVIDDAHTMTLPAQHAFLKLLEEPQPNTHFILVSHKPDLLLPTIRSRLQSYLIPRVPDAEFKPLVNKLTDDNTKRQQAIFVAAGRPALAKRLLENPDELEALATVMADAKTFVGGDRYKAFVVAQRYSTSKQSAQALVDAGMQILSSTLDKSAKAETIDKLRRLTNVYDNLSANAQPRLQLLSYVV